MASRRPRLMGESSSPSPGGGTASESRTELWGRRGGQRAAPSPRGTAAPTDGCPHLSILSQLSVGFFTMAGRTRAGAAFAVSVTQGSLRVQHRPSPHSAWGRQRQHSAAPTCRHMQAPRADLCCSLPL